MRFIHYFLLIGVIGIAGCGSGEGNPSGIEIRQYASYVIGFSSQWTITGGYYATEALGKEDIFPLYGDLSGTWASLTPDDFREHIMLGFDTLQTVRAVEIFETYNPGAIDTVYLRNASTQVWVVVYSRPFEILPSKARKFTFFFNETDFHVDAIRIALNSPEVPGWNEIDAVAINGYRKKGEGD